MDELLTDVEARVLGSLIEKEVTTPDYYPLSLNALTNACNQSSNRHPVMDLDEDTVSRAIDALRKRSLVRALPQTGSRVMKYSHLVRDAWNLDAPEAALMCVLMLRGPQTVGELRTRTNRLYDFTSLADVETVLNALSERESAPLVARLPRKAGQKEVRYAHLLSGEVAFDAPDVQVTRAAADADRITALEETVAELRKELDDVRTQLDAFRKQFE